MPFLTFFLCMIFTENRFPSPIGVEDKLFGIMHSLARHQLIYERKRPPETPKIKVIPGRA
jgi:hypothetical protein